MTSNSTTEVVKHTPGPWRVEFPTNPDAMSEIFAPTTDAYPWRVAYVMRDSNKHQQSIDDANARLIAVSPDLLAACVEAYEWIAQYADALPVSAVKLSVVLQAAIAKARGAQ